MGAGIHGLSLANEMAARGWSDILLIDKNQKISTAEPFNPFWLFNLFNFNDMGQYAVSLRELRYLAEFLPLAFTKFQFDFPFIQPSFVDKWFYRSLLYYYRRSLRRGRLHKIPAYADAGDQLQKMALPSTSVPDVLFNESLFQKALVQQTKDSLGASFKDQILTATSVEHLKADENGWSLKCIDQQSQRHIQVSALYVLLANPGGMNRLLRASSLPVHIASTRIVSQHFRFGQEFAYTPMILANRGLRSSIRIYNRKGHGLITLENTRSVGKQANDPQKNFQQALLEHPVLNQVFSRLDCHADSLIEQIDTKRTVAIEGQSFKRQDRKFEPGLLIEYPSQRGCLYALYNAKLPSYRACSRALGRKIAGNFGDLKVVPATAVNTKSGPILLRSKGSS